MSEQLWSRGSSSAGAELSPTTIQIDATEDTFNRVVIQDMVATQALTRPDSVAVATSRGSISYRELELRASQLAHHLLSRGAGPRQLVALCLQPSIASVISAYAVLKTGGAYVPLDPTWPLDRLHFMLNDSGAALVVTPRDVAPGHSLGQWQVVDLDLDREKIAGCPSSVPRVVQTAESLAYVIYTSGSTGRPKGVQIAQGGLMNLILWHQRAFEVAPSDRATLFASPGFDAAVWELWPYLCAGASVHVPADYLRSDAEGLREWLISEKITITFVPTALAELMIALKWPVDAPLRRMLTGGDRLHRYPPPGLPFDLINNYGPTECTVVATSGVVPPGGAEEHEPTIGRPISNTRVRILDENLRPMPVGATGELHISGIGVSLGYLNRPELTAEKFIPDPFSAVPGSRLYKTGDLGRYLPNRQIEYLGRTDDQVKIRGYRIEPGEIVATLNRHASIQASHVIAREGIADKELVAYIEPTAGSHPTAGELREFLLTHLPQYMVPAVFVLLDSLPRTSSGKVDRHALPSPNESNILRSAPSAPPQTVVQEQLAAILASLLGLPEVGLNNNFFELGGHSLLAIQVILRVKEVFGVEISMLSLFEAPTVAHLSAEIERLLILNPEAIGEKAAPQRLDGLASPNPDPLPG